MAVTAHDVASWMLGQLRQHGVLLQYAAALKIQKEFSPEWVYRNKNHNWAIRREVLDEFKALTAQDVVWSNGRKLWRMRSDYDRADRRSTR